MDIFLLLEINVSISQSFQNLQLLLLPVWPARMFWVYYKSNRDKLCHFDALFGRRVQMGQTANEEVALIGYWFSSREWTRPAPPDQLHPRGQLSRLAAPGEASLFLSLLLHQTTLPHASGVQVKNHLAGWWREEGTFVGVGGSETIWLALLVWAIVEIVELISEEFWKYKI